MENFSDMHLFDVFITNMHFFMCNVKSNISCYSSFTNQRSKKLNKPHPSSISFFSLHCRHPQDYASFRVLLLPQ